MGHDILTVILDNDHTRTKLVDHNLDINFKSNEDGDDDYSNSDDQESKDTQRTFLTFM